MTEAFEPNHTKEQLEESSTVAIATSTFYKNYYSGHLQDHDQVDKIRGNLALQMMGIAVERGYQLVVVDGNSSKDFQKEAADLGVALTPENERGMSAGRRQAILAASQLPGVKIVTWTEPEKVSMVRDCIEIGTKRIRRGEADISIPERGPGSFGTYPTYQVNYEQRANRRWNGTLRRFGFYGGFRDLDVWIGPRFIRNDPELIDLFMKKFEYKSPQPLSSEVQRDKNLELWANAIFLPLVSAMHKGYRVVGQRVPYLHPAEQTALEQDSPQFQQKRVTQYRNINMATYYLVRHLDGRDDSRLSLREAA